MRRVLFLLLATAITASAQNTADPALLAEINNAEKLYGFK